MLKVGHGGYTHSLLGTLLTKTYIVAREAGSTVPGILKKRQLGLAVICLMPAIKNGNARGEIFQRRVNWCRHGRRDTPPPPTAGA